MSNMEALGWAQLVSNIVCVVVMWMTCNGYSAMVKRERERVDHEISFFKDLYLALLKADINATHKNRPDSEKKDE